MAGGRELLERRDENWTMAADGITRNKGLQVRKLEKRPRIVMAG